MRTCPLLGAVLRIADGGLLLSTSCDPFILQETEEGDGTTAEY